MQGPLHDQGLVPKELTLDKTKAKTVLIFHTDSGLLGTKVPRGHVDFFANGGRTKDQPTCQHPKTKHEVIAKILGTCGHGLAILYGERAILGERMFGCPCKFRKTAPFKQPCPKPKNCQQTQLLPIVNTTYN